MKTTRFVLAAAFVVAGSAAFAAITTDSVIADYTAQGYTRIEVRSSLTQIKVEAIRGTEKIEVIFDKATGAILQQQVDTVGAFDNTTPGISLRERNRDFLRLVSAGGDAGENDPESATDDGTTDPAAGDDAPGHDDGTVGNTDEDDQADSNGDAGENGDDGSNTGDHSDNGTED